MKIFILKPSSLGDIVQALPVLRLLKLHIPQCQVFWWIDSRFSAVLEGDKDLSGLIYFDRYHWANPRYWGEVFRTVLNVRKERFDLVIDLQGLLRSGAFAWVASGKLLIGVDESRESANGFYDISVRRPSYYTHAVDWYLEVLRVLKIPVHFNFDWIPVRQDIADSVRRKWLNNSRFIVISPGGRWRTKRWYEENYVSLANHIAGEDKEVKFVVIGVNECFTTGEKIKAVLKDRCINLAGKTSILEMIEVIRLSEYIIANDTGPMHIAAALKKPVVAIFGPTEPRRTGPYGFPQGVVQASLPCIPCFKRKCKNPIELECMRLVTPEMVLGKIQYLKSAGLIQ
ncbi:MAG: glycosyltransferase family 9 protein [Limisphaerales bacterium]|jgi:lipopolysaccharide heptosyltransferase II